MCDKSAESADNYKKCDENLKCNVFEKDGTLKNELKKEILRKAAIYQKQTKDKNFKPYEVTDLKD